MMTKAMIESVIRALLVLITTMTGIELAETDSEKVVAGIAILASVVVSAYWSWRTHKRNIKTPPPAAMLALCIVPMAMMMVGGCSVQRAVGEVASESSATVQVARLRHAITTQAAIDAMQTSILVERIAAATLEHGRLVSAGYLIPGDSIEPDVDALRFNVESEREPADALWRSVRDGHFTLGSAQRWIEDYALLASTSNGRERRREMIEQLPVIAGDVAAGEALLEAFAEWCHETDQILVEVADGLGQVSSTSTDPFRVADVGAVVRSAILTRVPEAYRADAGVIAETLFGASNESR